MYDRLYPRGKTWWVDLRSLGGDRESTHCKDKKAAELVARRRERELADPRHVAANATTIADALKRLLTDRVARGRAGGTVDMYRSKGGHWTRILGRDTPLAKLDARAVDTFIEKRLEEGAARNTIGKELTTMRAALKVALRRGEWIGDVAAVMPVQWATEYEPRKRCLRSGAELQRLVDELPVDRGAHVCFLVATAARDSEAERAMRVDVCLARSTVYVRGEKTDLSDDSIAVVGWMRPLLEYALERAPHRRDQAGRELPLFRPWGNIRRDLGEACERAKLEPLTPNDLRRTHATWLRAGGVDLGAIARQLRHTDTRMVARVYGRLDAASVGGVIAAQMGCDVFVPEPMDRGALSALGGLGASTKSLGKLVPRDGIEPPTRGFSILPPPPRGANGRPTKRADPVKLRRVV